MSPIAGIEAIASLLWVFAGLSFVEWASLLWRQDRREHIPSLAELITNLVPVTISLVVVVMVGALIGLPSVVVIIALLFPAGFGFALTQSLNAMRDSTWTREILRLGAALAIGLGVIWWRQFA